MIEIHSGPSSSSNILHFSFCQPDPDAAFVPAAFESERLFVSSTAHVGLLSPDTHQAISLSFSSTLAFLCSLSPSLSYTITVGLSGGTHWTQLAWMTGNDTHWEIAFSQGTPSSTVGWLHHCTAKRECLSLLLSHSLSISTALSLLQWASVVWLIKDGRLWIDSNKWKKEKKNQLIRHSVRICPVMWCKVKPEDKQLLLQLHRSIEPQGQFSDWF